MFRVRMLRRTSIRNPGKLNSTDQRFAALPDGIRERRLPNWSCLQPYTKAVSTHREMFPSSCLLVVIFC